ncbi:nitroreductase family deazaflavin-dependent oxidoreductase [Mycolicibacterium sp. XJ870]
MDIPVLILTSIGAHSGRRCRSPLAYITDGDDVVLVASNFGRDRHPAWYHNLLAHPECELHFGRRGGSFVAREVEGADRDRLYALAATRLHQAWTLYEQRVNRMRSIPVLRLTPVSVHEKTPQRG